MPRSRWVRNSPPSKSIRCWCAAIRSKRSTRYRSGANEGRMMGKPSTGKKSAAIVGFTEWKPQKKWTQPMFALEAMAQLAAEALADAGFDKSEIDGIVMSH